MAIPAADSGYGRASINDLLLDRDMIETFILDYHDQLDGDSFTLHGRRSFLKPEPMHSFTKAFDRHIDNTRTPYSYRGNSKTTCIRTAIKEEPKKLAPHLRARLLMPGQIK